MKKFRDIIRKLFTIVLTAVTGFFLVLAIYNFISIKILKHDYSNVFGYTLFEVISGSMSPEIQKGDLILVKLDTDYKKGDIISYKSKDGVFVTHRIIEIKDGVYITKGDSNNTIDTPVKKDMIAGKVVKIIGNLGVWVKVFTTPKVILSTVVTALIICYTISVIKKEVTEDDKKKKKELNKETVIDMIMKSKKLKAEVFILVLLLLALLFLVPYTLSRFKSEARGDAKIDYAFFVVSDTYNHQSITLNDMKPGDSNSYTFTVSNTDTIKRTEVSTSYYIYVRATTNLPLQYSLYLMNGVNETNIVSNSEVITDDDGMYFKIMETSSRDFGFDVDETDTYKLTVDFPAELKSYKYQGVAENIEINVRGKQILDSDN